MYRGTTKKPVKIAIYGLLILLCIWAIFPFYWVITTSFKLPKDTLGTKLVPFVDFQPTLENWKQEVGRRWPELSKGL